MLIANQHAAADLRERITELLADLVRRIRRARAGAEDLISLHAGHTWR